MYKSEINIRKVKNQIFAVYIANIGTFVFGNGYGWLSPSLATLNSPEHTPLLPGPATVDQIALTTAFWGSGCVIGPMIAAFISKKWGIKTGIAAGALPALLNWIFIILGDHIEYLYVARLFSGISGGTQYYLIPLFVAEISDPLIRGRMGTFLIGNQCLGILLMYVVASYVDYYIVPYIFLPFPIIFFVLFYFFVPSTPQYLIMNDNLQKAEQSIRFYKNLYDDSPETHQKVKEEVENVKVFIKERLTTEKMKLSDFTTKEALQGTVKAIFLLFTYIGGGNLVFFSYAATIFRESGSNFDPNISSIIIAIIQLCGVLLATTFIDKIGRRPLMIMSSFGCFTGLIALGLFNYLSLSGYDVNVVNWVPVTSMALALLTGSCGVLPVTFVLLAEIFPAKIRRVTSLTFLLVLNIVLTISTSTFPVLVDLYGLYTPTWMLAVLACFGIFFSIFILKDTTGKNIN